MENSKIIKDLSIHSIFIFMIYPLTYLKIKFSIISIENIQWKLDPKPELWFN